MCLFSTFVEIADKDVPNKNRVHNSQLDHMGISRDLQVAYGCIEYVVHHLKSVDDSQKVGYQQ